MTKEIDLSQAPESLEFRAEIQQLLNILVHSLYTEREIFLRELVSNASDALNRVQFEMLTNHDVVDRDAELAIRIQADADGRKLMISDTGIGMTRDEIVGDLGVIAHSGAAAFLQEIQQQNRPGVELIGQFGVGFYSVFMIADHVKVISRSYLPDAQAIEWTSDGGSSYQLRPGDKPDRGTRIEIQLKEDADEFAQAWRLEQIVRKHSDFVTFPIYVGDGQEPVNRRTALWRQPPSQVTKAQYDEFYKHLTLDLEEPLLCSHLVSEAPIDVRSILYVPSRRDDRAIDPRADHGLKLYVHNVLIQESNRDLLPPYWRFVEGVVESADLPLNISRETVQSSPVARHIQKALIRKLTKELEALSEEDPSGYSDFWNQFGIFIKEGIATDPSAKDGLLPLLRFSSSQSGDMLTPLASYVERMAEDQEAIYYILGDDPRSVVHSPHLDHFAAHDIEVLYLVDPIDSFMMLTLQEYDGRPLQNVDDGRLELSGKEPADANAPGSVPEVEFNRLVGRFVKVLGSRVREVRESRVLRDSPCRLVTPDDGPSRQMSRVQRMLDRDFEMPTRILEINRNHPIVANLAHLVSAQPDEEIIDPAIEQLFENQLLIEGLHPNPADMIQRVHQLVQRATYRDRTDSAIHD